MNLPSSAPELPAGFTQRTIELYGARGQAWLDDLPQLIGQCAQRWELLVESPFPLSYNYVAPAAGADGQQYVLKLGVPNPALSGEIAALRHFDGQGSVRLVHSDPKAGILLLERLLPGTSLAELQDDQQATRIAAGVMRKMWKPPPQAHSFPSMADWVSGLSRLRSTFGGGFGPFSPALVERAEALSTALLASSQEPTLLHGDLHHENILYDERRGWLAVDPQGVVGEPAFECGALLHNPLPGIAVWANLPHILSERLDLLSTELHLDRQRLHGWGLVRAVLSGWWDYEDHGHGWEPVLAVAQALMEIQ